MEAEPAPGLITQLSQLYKAFHKRTTEEHLGMRLRQFLALSKVRDYPRVSQQDLSDALAMDPNSVVLLLNELEELGYSVRRRDPLDRRRHTVELTEAGRQALVRAEKGRESIEDEVLSTLTPEEKATLRRILTKALEGLTRVPADATTA